MHLNLYLNLFFFSISRYRIPLPLSLSDYVSFIRFLCPLNCLPYYPTFLLPSHYHHHCQRHSFILLFIISFCLSVVYYYLVLSSSLSHPFPKLPSFELLLLLLLMMMMMMMIIIIIMIQRLHSFRTFSFTYLLLISVLSSLSPSLSLSPFST